MALEHGQEPVAVRRIAGLDDKVEDQAASAGGQVELVAILNVAGALDDDVGVRLEQAALLRFEDDALVELRERQRNCDVRKSENGVGDQDFVRPGIAGAGVERSSGATRRQGGITKAGNGVARRMLIEAAWSYRFPARISREQLLRQEGLAKPIRDAAWKVQERLCRRYRKLARAGKSPTVVTTAIARELSGLVWAIAKHLQVASA